jgi:hypothetical protein
MDKAFCKFRIQIISKSKKSNYSLLSSASSILANALSIRNV